MKLKCLPLLCLCCFVITSCHSTNKASHSPALETSAGTKMFIEQLKNENAAKPSADFVQLFSLRNINQQYYVSGIAKVNKALDEKQLAKLGVRTNTKAGNIFTLLIPLKNFKRFLKLKGIDYFEVSEKITIDKT